MLGDGGKIFNYIVSNRHLSAKKMSKFGTVIDYRYGYKLGKVIYYWNNLIRLPYIFMFNWTKACYVSCLQLESSLGADTIGKLFYCQTPK